jgi:hypothetical protein
MKSSKFSQNVLPANHCARAHRRSDNRAINLQQLGDELDSRCSRTIGGATGTIGGWESSASSAQRWK